MKISITEKENTLINAALTAIKNNNVSFFSLNTIKPLMTYDQWQLIGIISSLLRKNIIVKFTKRSFKLNLEGKELELL